MARSKRERTPEQIEADKARMAKAREARQNKNPKTKEATYSVGLPEEILPIQTQEPAEEPLRGPEPQEDTIIQPDVTELVRQVQELKAMMFDQVMNKNRQENDGASVANGKLTGTKDRYSMDKSRYPDPRERLAVEPKLARFAFPLNYELQWEIGESAYETIDHVRQREPRFTLTLVKIMLDEDTGEDTNGRYDICRLIMHEDPIAAMTIARENGLEVDDQNEVSFLNEMRYIRMRDWLLEAFYPSKPTSSNTKRDMVINGKLVSYWEKNAEADNDTGIKKVNWDNITKIKF